MIGIAVVCAVTLTFIVLEFVEDKVKSKVSKKRNRVHFYVARDKNGELWLYIGKPIREKEIFNDCHEIGVRTIGHDGVFKLYSLNENDYKDLKWDDEPVEVFVNMED